MIRILTEKRVDGLPVPFSIRVRSRDGKDMSNDNVICHKAYPDTGKRFIEYIASGQKRMIRDCLIIQINEYRIKQR